MNNFNQHISTIYAITDPLLLPGNKLFYAVEAALDGGIRTVQLRNKDGGFRDKLKQAQQLVKLCEQFQAQLIINDDVGVTQESGAHGVHLGQEDTSISLARKTLGASALIGITCHCSIDLARQAAEDGADYVAFGRFFTSKTKPNASIAPRSIIQDAKNELSLPIVAIGGITNDNMHQVIKDGADSIAVCHSLFAAKDIKQQAQTMVALFQQ